MKFLDRIRALPERNRKIILWVTLIVVALVLFNFWFQSLQKKFEGLRLENLGEELNLPKFEIPLLK